MDFFSRQDHARSLTRRLALLFTAAVIATVVAVNIITYIGVSYYIDGQRLHDAANVEATGPSVSSHSITELHITAQIIVTVITLAIIGFGSLFKTMQLRGGGPTVAMSLGGRPARPDSDAKERQFVNVVEEMSLASGVAMPQVYVLDREEGVNAFAAGLGQHDAVVAVTAGALKRFNRDELQAVIGHEFSHILNGDMRINIRLIGLLHGILVIALTGQLILRMAFYSGHSRSSRDNKGGAIPIFVVGLALFIIGSIGHVFGQLIKAAISRQREFLADASAVQFTRNPGSMASALKKLGSRSKRSFVQSRNTAEASHLFFGNAVAMPWFGGFATHPPLEDRIRAIDPSWDGTYPEIKQDADEPIKEIPKSRRQPHAALGGLAAAAVIAQVGTVTPAQVAFGAALLASIPDSISSAAHDPFSVRAVIVSLLLGTNQAKAVPLYDLLERASDRALAREVRRLHGPIAQLGSEARLPLLDISFPALSQLSDSQKKPFLDLLDQIAKADGVLDPSEYCLTRLVRAHLIPPRNNAGIYAMKPLLPSLSILLSALSYFGHKDLNIQQKAFAAGAACLIERGTPMTMLPMNACGPKDLDAAFEKLQQASPGLKRRILNACAHAIAADGVVQPQEAELLRVIGMMLETPIPNFADQNSA